MIGFNIIIVTATQGPSAQAPHTVDLNRSSGKSVLGEDDIQDPLALEGVVKRRLPAIQLVVGDHIGVNRWVSLHMGRPSGPPSVGLVGRPGVSGTTNGDSRRDGESSSVLCPSVVPHLEVLILASRPEEVDVRFVLWNPEDSL
jgi:hypothetical protein